MNEHYDFLADIVDVDDVVLGHLLLEKRLRNGCQDEAAGEAFHICPAEPCTYREFYDTVISVARQRNFSKCKFRIQAVPERFVMLLSIVVDMVRLLLPASVDIGPYLGDMRFVSLSTTAVSVLNPIAGELRNFKAQRILGYKPHLSREGLVKRILREFEANTILFD